MCQRLLLRQPLVPVLSEYSKAESCTASWWLLLIVSFGVGVDVPAGIFFGACVRPDVVQPYGPQAHALGKSGWASNRVLRAKGRKLVNGFLKQHSNQGLNFYPCARVFGATVSKAFAGGRADFGPGGPKRHPLQFPGVCRAFLPQAVPGRIHRIAIRLLESASLLNWGSPSGGFNQITFGPS